jgi:glycosyltransferase involved in cell wall biosynthesis
VIVNVPVVTVLLATYNGEKFLEQQLESLAVQEGVQVQVVANDDGSTDSTVAILEKWIKKGLIKKVVHTNRLGANKSFLRLLSIELEGDYFAFCDQDDVWHPRKLKVLLNEIDLISPQMVFCARSLIDETGMKITQKQAKSIKPSFQNALVENLAPANTVVINSSAKSLIARFSYANAAYFDSWMYLLISGVGTANYINQQLVEYRIHRGNTVGLRKYRLSKTINAVQNYIFQAHALLTLENSLLKADCRAYLIEFLETIVKKSFIQLFFMKVHRNKFIDNLVFKLCLIFIRLRRGAII